MFNIITYYLDRVILNYHHSIILLVITQSNLLLFLVITTVLLTSPLVFGTVFASPPTLVDSDFKIVFYFDPSTSIITIPNVTVGTQNDRLFVVSVALDQQVGPVATVSSVTFGPTGTSCSVNPLGESFTRVLSSTSEVSNKVRNELWYLTAPSASQTCDIIINLTNDVGSTSDTSALAAFVLFSEVDQTTPIDNAVTATGNSLTPSVSIPNTNDHFILDVMSSVTDGLTTQGSNQDLQGGYTNLFNFLAGTSTQSGNLDSTMDWVITPGPGVPADDWAISAITIHANTISPSAPILNTIGNQSGDELSPITFTANATDADIPAETLSFSLSGAPNGSVINGTTGVFTWTPTESQTNSTFDVIVSDGILSDSETITIIVNEVNVSPISISQSITTNEDTPKSFTLNATDTDIPIQSLTFTILTQPAKGTLSGTTPNLTYTPNANYNGVDSFTFNANDGILNSTSTISITVNSVDDDGIISYRSNTGINGLNSPKIKIWGDAGSGNWGNEIELPSAGSPIRHLVLKHSPISAKNVLVTQSDDGNLDAYVCQSTCNQALSWTVTNNIGQVASTAINQKRFDVSFESSTGDAMIVYSVLSTNTTRDMAYKILPSASSSFAGIVESYIDDNSANGGSDLAYTWVSMDKKPTSEEISLIGFDSTGLDINAWIWSGNTWGNRQEITASATSTGGNQAIGIKYISNGSKAFAMGGDGVNGNIAVWNWNGITWTNSADFDIDTSDTLDASWMTLKPDPTSDDLQVAIVDSGSDLATAYWSGSAWTVTSNIDTNVDVNSARPVDFAWNPTGSNGKLVWDTDTTGSTLSQRTCSPTCTGTTTFTSYSGTGAWMSLHTNPDSVDIVDIVGIRLNNAFDIGSFMWNGTLFTNYGDSAITADTTVTTFESYSFDFTN